MANNRSLDLTIISAKGLNKLNLVGKMDVYAVVYISGGVGHDQKQKTHVDVDGDANPTWNYSMKFQIDESAALQNRLTLVVKIKTEGMFGDKDVGEVHVPVKELIDGSGGKPLQFVSYQVRKPSGKPKGELSFSYKFDEKVNGVTDHVTAYPAGIPNKSEEFVTPYPAGKPVKSEEPVTAYPAGASGSGMYPPPYAATAAPAGAYPPPAAVAAPAGYPAAVGASYPAPAGYPQPQAGYAYQQHQQQPPYGGYAQPPQPGYGGYPPPQPGYGGYPPPQPGYGYPPVQQPQQPKKKNKFGMGLGAGLLGGALGGLLIGDIVSDAADGGGCGGGGCGGGCGGF